jgi:nitrite reductase/ring-hydroxylating ferredoxin subunit
MSDASRAQWFPVAASHDLPFRHVYHAELLGQELAVWRADDGFVNVWENRCLHRGVRLSIGLNLGDSLKCQYHGWLYSSRTSGCTYIPAHPENAPARLICNKVFPAVERYGLVWSRLEGEGGTPSIAGAAENATVLRSIPVKAAAAKVVDLLLQEGAMPLSDHAVRLADENAIILAQPQNDSRTILRGLVFASAPEGGIALLHRFNDRLKALRDRLEGRA